jgi:DNA helicase-2/ATP-dependent DNA helicase PcrA
VKDLLGILRWADNPRNAVAAFRVVQLLPGMGPAHARKAIEHLETQNYSFEALKSFEAPQPSAVDWRKLTALMLELGNPERQWPGQVHLAREWYRPHLERIYEHFHTRVGDLDQLELLSSQYVSRERFITELTLDPPDATSDLAGQPVLDEDYLVLSTIHSAKGMEWDTVFVLNVVDGSFPSEFATGRAELIEEERRLLYVAMTRAQNDLFLLAPLRFPVTSQSRQSDAHVYGGRSRFLTDKVIKAFDADTVRSAQLGEATLKGGEDATIDVGAKLKEMW